MSLTHYKAFNLDHAKDGAPFKTRDGQTVTVVEWDGKNEHWPILAYYGTSNKVGQWAKSGVDCSQSRDLVMVPLGFMEGDPVYAGDTIGSGKVILRADPKMHDFSAFHWPAPGEVAGPVANLLFEHNLAQVYKMLGVNEYTEALDEIGSLQTAASSLKSVQDTLGVSSYAGALQVIGHLRSEVKSKTAANVRLSGQLDQALTEREHNRDMADNLANAISNYFCEDIGEHSNVNCPWKEALDTMEDASGKMFVAESVVLDVAASVFEEALRHVNFSFSGKHMSVGCSANIKEMLADAFATLRHDQTAAKVQETESETKNPAGFGHG